LFTRNTTAFPAGVVVPQISLGNLAVGPGLRAIEPCVGIVGVGIDRIGLMRVDIDGFGVEPVGIRSIGVGV
jgi:hypothetical protein